MGLVLGGDAHQVGCAFGVLLHDGLDVFDEFIHVLGVGGDAAGFQPVLPNVHAFFQGPKDVVGVVGLGNTVIVTIGVLVSGGVSQIHDGFQVGVGGKVVGNLLDDALLDPGGVEGLPHGVDGEQVREGGAAGGPGLDFLDVVVPGGVHGLNGDVELV